MSIKKHNLTTHKDHLAGVNGTDLFVGTKGELGSNDVLNGGGGIDTISAVLTGKLVAPVMASIEKGTFTFNSKTNITLDLAHAAQMRQLTVHDTGNAPSNAVDLNVLHASHVAAVTLRNVDSSGDVSISGIDAAVVKKETLSLDHYSTQTLTLNTLHHAAFDTLDISMNRTYYATLAGDVAARSIVIHSLGKEYTHLEIDPAGKRDVHDLTITGSADSSLDLNPSSFNELAFVDASDLHAGVAVTLSSHSLQSVTGGSGDDEIRIDALGGTKTKNAIVSLGDGVDRLDVTGLHLNAANMHFSGGKGYDTIAISGSSKNIGALQDGFEELRVADAAGTYHLGSGWKGFAFANATDAADKVTVQDGSGLRSVKGSIFNDYFRVDELGGTSAHKAVVDLESGNDFINLSHMSLDATSQSFNGNNGTDGFRMSGHVADLGALFQGFEYGTIYDAQGAYNIGSSGISTLAIGSSSGIVSFNNMSSGSITQLMASQGTLLTIGVVDAATLTTETHRIELHNAADLGNNVFGLNAPDLSNLDIVSQDSAHTLYLSTIGGATDAATLMISGNAKLTLAATTGSTSYIDGIVSTNTAGLDMQLLLAGTKALASTGVTISGGNGSDVLVGGTGADTILSGGGDNKIHGSLGIDSIDISLGGQDMLIFQSQAQSAYANGDDVTGFNIFDGIDISDVVSSVTFGGNVATLNAGLAKLSTGHSVAFFETGNHTLYVDVNHDGQLFAGDDMEFHLAGLDSFNSGSLIG